MEAYCLRYLDFVNTAKTERETVQWVVAAAREAGFRPLTPGERPKTGDKVYYVNREKSITLAVIGRQPPQSGVRITACHVDSPRLDLKPNPLYESEELALFKTHYYGSIKKYQWTAMPLALHGVIALTDGSTVPVCVGEKPGDPVFSIPELLIHLSQEQLKQPMAQGIPAEKLNVLVGSIPLPEEAENERIKLAILELLNREYGITEEDLISAELCLVPALPAREVGFDRSLLGAYGHDDKVCVYACLEPLFQLETPEHTAVCLLADKEEIGSEGVSGMRCEVFEWFMERLCPLADLRECYANSVCLSADVTAAMDPNNTEVFDPRNSNRVNYGVALSKYNGSGGKGGTSDASAELVARVRRTLARAGVLWQAGELGKVDAGGGGTVANYMAQRNIDTLDAGVPLLSMHAPWETVGKLDAYMMMKACGAFYAMEG